MYKSISAIMIFVMILSTNIATLENNSLNAEKVQNNHTELTTESVSELSFEPKSHDFGDKYEGDVDNTTFEIWNSGCCSLMYKIIEECSWITVEPEEGSSIGEHDTITVTIDTTNLNVGVHSYDILIDGSSSDGYFSVQVNIIEEEINNAPDKPTLDGPTSGECGKQYNYTVITNDSDDDQILYKWDWGDGNISTWLGPYESNNEVTESHIWKQEGNYTIMVKAKDEHEAESEWSDPLSIIMPKNKPYSSTLLLRFLENHPYLFPLLKQLLELQ